jgi:hypothetical protein
MAAVLLNVAVPAFELSKNFVVPAVPVPKGSLMLVLLNTVLLPAVARFVNAIVPTLPDRSMFVLNCWVTPELFVMPTPLTVRVVAGLGTMKNEVGCGTELKTISLTSVSADIETWLIEEEPNVAISAGPFGTVMGDQLGALFQLPLGGVVDHVALPAKAEPVAKNIGIITAKTMERACVCRSRRKAAAGCSGEVARIRLFMSFL